MFFSLSAPYSDNSLKHFAKRSVEFVQEEVHSCWDPLFWPSSSIRNDHSSRNPTNISNQFVPPNFQECAQQSLLVFFPALFFWFLVPIFVAQVWRTKRMPDPPEPLPHSRIQLAKMLITVLLFVDALFFFSKYFDPGDFYALQFPVASFIGPLIRAVTMVGLFQCQRVCRRNGLVTSGIIHWSWIMHSICTFPELYSWCQKLFQTANSSTIEFPEPEAIDLGRAAAFALWLLGCWAQTWLHFYADPRKARSHLTDDNTCSPELDSSFFNRLLLCWFNPMVALGHRKALELRDLWTLNPNARTEQLLSQWDQYWTDIMEEYIERVQEAEADDSGIEATDLLGNNDNITHQQKEKTEQDQPKQGTSNIDAKFARSIRRPLHFKTSKRLLPPSYPSVVKNLALIFRWQLLASAAVKLIADLLQFMNPIMLKWLIEFAERSKEEPLWKGLMLALAMFIVSECRSFALNFYFYTQFRISVYIQGILTAAIYKKTLKLASSARRDRTVGEIVNLMSIDVERFGLIVPHVQQFWSSPLQIGIALMLLFQTLGIAALPGFVLMTVFIPLSVYSTHFTRRWQMKQMRLKDERSRICSELFNGIKVVKLYAWERPMIDRIEDIRRKELRELVKSNIVRAFIDTVNFTSPMLVAVCSFLAFIWIDPMNNVLTPQVAFVSLTLFNMIRSPLAMIGFMINLMSQWVVSNDRLKRFFVEDELLSDDYDRNGEENHYSDVGNQQFNSAFDPNNTNNNERESEVIINSVGSLDADEGQETSVRLNQHRLLPMPVIELHGANFSWERRSKMRKQDSQTKTTGELHGLEFVVPHGQLVVVIGRVGAGKSNLLSAIIGEMNLLCGVKEVRGRIAYAAQTPWIRNQNVRDNILFGRPIDSELYNRVLDSCGLGPDIELLPEGDLTEIGERGVNLSGGQKARIALARTIFQMIAGCDLFLLDDPLSAVDANVGKRLFDQVIGPKGILAGYTRILVTHSTTFLPQADYIVVMEEGRIVESGTYNELIKNNNENYLRRIITANGNDEDTGQIDEKNGRKLTETTSTKSLSFDNNEVDRNKSAVVNNSFSFEDDRSNVHEEEEGHESNDDRGAPRLPMDAEESPSIALELANERLRLASFTSSSSVKTRSRCTPQRCNSSSTTASMRSSVAATGTSVPQTKINSAFVFIKKNNKMSKSLINRHHKRSVLKKSTTENVIGTPFSSPDNHREQSQLSERKRSVRENSLIKKEHIETGHIRFAVYIDYIRAAGIPFLLFLALYIANQTLATYRNFWLSDWSEDNARTSMKFSIINNGTTNRQQEEKQKVPFSTEFRLTVYAGVGAAEGLCFFIALVALIFGSKLASRRFHNPLLETIMRAPIQFFDSTPIGRLLNRFSKDIDVLDSVLPLNTRYLVNCCAQVVVTITTIVISVPLFLTVVVPMFAIYFLILRYYLPTSRQLKRLESAYRSPLYTQFGETIQGVQTIRASRRSAEFHADMLARVDEIQCIRYMGIVANRWLAVRLEFIGCTVVFFTALFGVLSNHFGWVNSAGLIGLSIAYALNITDFLNFAVRQLSEVESNVVSVERLKEYLDVPSEAPWRGAEEKRHALPTDWPNRGEIVFQNYATRYRSGLDLALRGINIRLEPGQRVGIVGRTGAGKSTLALALFRMVEPVEGQILIDGVDITKIGLHELRSKLTIIPQDPVLFSGTLRFNLDPFGRYSDADLWRALELAHLKEFVSDLPDGIDHHIDEGGENISLGQRQLLCLARACLRRCRILVLDEATASIDLATDALVQETIRREFFGSTVLTIAHRLDTVLDYDQVAVLDRGVVVEFGSPTILLTNNSENGASSSRFAAMLATASNSANIADSTYDDNAKNN